MARATAVVEGELWHTVREDEGWEGRRIDRKRVEGASRTLCTTAKDESGLSWMMRGGKAEWQASPSRADCLSRRRLPIAGV